eukprot:Nitzschia sp. Nitz4//NODE_202_length_38933_cov_72.610268//7858//8505//NITZ4_additional_000019-RA//1//CDS//3329531777//1498//frame0
MNTFSTRNLCMMAVIAVAALVCLVGATPSITCTSTANANALQYQKVFGIPGTPVKYPVACSSNNPLLIRGGAVTQADSPEQVDALVLKAAANDLLLVIDFTATWCGPCKSISPLFEQMSEESDDVLFVKVDVDENPETAAKYSVSAMPTFLFIKKGEVIDRLMGANPARLQAMIEEHS